MNIITISPDGQVIEADTEAIYEHLGNAYHLRKRLESHPYPPSELLKMGRENIKDRNYLEAKAVFDELWTSSITPDMKRIAEIYGILIDNMAASNTPVSLMMGYRPGIEGIMYCMKKAKDMHKEKRMKKEDLFAMEKILDNIEFSRLKINNRKEFEEIYCDFKEYISDVPMKDRKK